MISSTDTQIGFSAPPALPTHIAEIAKQIILHKNEVNYSGLLGGKAGITLLFAYLSKIFPEKNYLQTTFEYLDELNDALGNEAMDHSMSAGVAGIAFIYQHLLNIGILDVSDDLNLSELDAFIDRGIDVDFQMGNWDPLHGMVGLGIYFLERNKETGEKKYLEKIVDYLAGMRTTVGNHQLWMTPGYGTYSDDNYNFGMAHGMPGVLSFLAQTHARGIRQQAIDEMITSCLPFLLQYEYADDAVYSFPPTIDLHLKKEKLHARLAWCYGDLSMAIALVHCGKALQNENLQTKGIEVALKTTHRTLENSGCADACFCHGAVGLAHQYHRLYQCTNNERFKAAADYWIDLTLQHFYKPSANGDGYYFQAFNEETKTFEFHTSYGLLEGSAGIALVYLSYLYNLNPNWDIIFLTNV
jgi:lantibiotic modifying enzyme